MEYEYNKRRLTGTRDEVINQLRNYLNSCELTWSLGAWHLCIESLEVGCRPEEAKKAIIDIVLLRVPKQYFFKGNAFEDIEDLRSYLRILEVRHLGDGVFALYTYAKRLNINMSFHEIKEALIEDIINDI